MTSSVETDNGRKLKTEFITCLDHTIYFLLRFKFYYIFCSSSVQDQSYDGSDQQELDAERLASQSSVAATKRVQMDGDGDGAPSYTETSPKRQIGNNNLTYSLININ